MTTNLSTHVFSLQNAIRFQNDIIDANNYYLFAADYLPHANADPQPIYDDVSNNYTNVWTNMLFGKQISSNDVFLMIQNIPWTSNTVYSMYNDNDTNLPTEQFFVNTVEGSTYHVWKVLDNNFGVPSTDKPLFAHAASTPYYQTTDGYRWKYMTSIPNATVAKFELSNYFPIIANTTVEAAAVPGALDIFLLTGNGAFYNNYLYGTFQASDLNISGQPTLYNIANSSIVQTNGYYTGCLIYLSSGTGQGQYKTITNYQANTLGNIITIDSPFLPAPLNGTVYQITPQISIVSDGSQSINCVARALINASASNSIYRIETLNAGAGYFNVRSVNVIANSSVGISNNAVIDPILSPPNGHGANVYAELYCNSVGLSVYFSNSEANTIPVTNIYQQVGIMKDPLFANVNLRFTGNFGLFANGEPVYSVQTKQFNTNATVTATSTNVSCNLANFVAQLANNDYVVMSNIEQTLYQIVQVVSVTNTSQFVISSPGLWSCTQSVLYSTQIWANAVVSTVTSANNIIVTNCSSGFQQGDFVIGSTSGASGVLNTVKRNGVTEYFGTFFELYKYNVTILSGTFTQDEVVSQGSNTGYLFASVPDGGTVALYLNNFTGGPMQAGNNILGQTSSAAATVNEAFVPDVIYGSADILYLENVEPITRTAAQRETFQTVIGF